MPEEPTKETSGPEICPKNPFGHSWKRIDRLGDQAQQRCRFCQQTRTVRLPSSLQERERQARQGP